MRSVSMINNRLVPSSVKLHKGNACPTPLVIGITILIHDHALVAIRLPVACEVNKPRIISVPRIEGMIVAILFKKIVNPLFVCPCPAILNPVGITLIVVVDRHSCSIIPNPNPGDWQRVILPNCRSVKNRHHCCDADCLADENHTFCAIFTPAFQDPKKFMKCIHNVIRSFGLSDCDKPECTHTSGRSIQQMNRFGTLAK